MARTESRWRTTQVSDHEVQVYPLNDLVDHEPVEDTCVCGPRAECLPREGDSDSWMYVHHALDGRD